jgi:hypothetical protein
LGGEGVLGRRFLQREKDLPVIPAKAGIHEHCRGKFGTGGVHGSRIKSGMTIYVHRLRSYAGQQPQDQRPDAHLP